MDQLQKVTTIWKQPNQLFLAMSEKETNYTDWDAEEQDNDVTSASAGQKGFVPGYFARQAVDATKTAFLDLADAFTRDKSFKVGENEEGNEKKEKKKEPKLDVLYTIVLGEEYVYPSDPSYKVCMLCRAVI